MTWGDTHPVIRAMRWPRKRKRRDHFGDVTEMVGRDGKRGAGTAETRALCSSETTPNGNGADAQGSAPPAPLVGKRTAAPASPGRSSPLRKRSSRDPTAPAAVRPHTVAEAVALGMVTRLPEQPVPARMIGSREAEAPEGFQEVEG